MTAFESRGQSPYAKPHMSAPVRDILIQTAMSAQLNNLPSFGPQDVLLTMLRENNLLLRCTLQSTLPRATNPFALQEKLEFAISKNPRRLSEYKAVEPAEEMKEVYRLAEQYAREQEMTEYTPRHVLKAIFALDSTQEINAACQDLGINRRALARQL